MASNINFEITARNAASGAIRSVSGDLGGLSGAAKRAGIGLKAAFVGAGVAVAALTKFVVDSTKKAMEEEKIQRRLIAVMETRKMVTAETTKAIEDQVVKGRSLAFASNEIRQTMAAALPYAEDFGQAIKIQNAAMDVAAAQGISLSKATMIVTRAYIGQGKSLAKLGIETSRMVEKNVKIRHQTKEKGVWYEKEKKLVKEVIKGQEVLDLITGKVGGTASKVAQSTEKQFEIFKLTIDDMQQQLGSAFLPIASKIARVLNENILPKVQPLMDGAVAFLTDQVPKALAALDPLIQSFTGTGGVVDSVTALATAIWDNGNGVLALALAGIGDLFVMATQGLNDFLTLIGVVPKKVAPVSAIMNRDAWWVDLYNKPAKQTADYAPVASTRDMPWLDQMMGPKGPNLTGTVALPGGINASKQGLAYSMIAPVASIALRMLTGGRVKMGLGATASMGAGMYALGSSNASTPMDALMSYGAGAGTSQALLAFGLPTLMSMFGGGKPQVPGQAPGLFGRLKNTLMPGFLRSGPGIGGVGAALGGGPMSMNAQVVYLNAAQVVGGGGMPGMMPPGMMPGMIPPAGVPMNTPPSRWAQFATRFGGTRFGAPIVAAGTRIAGFGSSIANSGIAQGIGRFGGVVGRGLGALGAGVPIIGGIAAGMQAAAEGKGVGESIGTGIGSAAGTAIGAGLLSWIPIAGPILGGALGGALGSAIGGAIGSAIEGAVDPAVQKVNQEAGKAMRQAMTGRDSWWQDGGGKNNTFTGSGGLYGSSTPSQPFSYLGSQSSYQPQDVQLKMQQPVDVKTTVMVDGQKMAQVVNKYLGAQWRGNVPVRGLQ